LSISHVGTGVATAATLSVAPTMPAGLQAGDLIVVSFTNGAVATTWSAPSGYTLLQSTTDGANCQTAIYYRIATGSSDAFTTTQTAGTRFICNVVAYRGVDGTDPFIDDAIVAEGASSVTVHTAPSITNSDAAAWGVYAGATRGTATPFTWTAGTGLTERIDTDAGLASGSNLASTFSDSNGVVATGAKSYFGTASAAQAVATMWAGFLRPAVVDVAPDAPTISTPTEAEELTTADFDITGTAQADSTVTLYDAADDSVIDTATATGGAWTISLVDQVDGSYAVYATATDAGGESDPSADRNYTVAIPVGGGSPGTIGDTLQYSMNRIAGTLDASGVPTLDATGAANVYADTDGLALQGALNVAAGNELPHYLDLQGVLNQLAGTTGLGVDGAASQIEA